MLLSKEHAIRRDVWRSLVRTRLGRAAIVAGRSMAAVVALSKYFERVLIIDKDPLSPGAEPRLGVGQGHHLHNLVRRGTLDREAPPGGCM
jgi:hypothetical protein